MLYGHNAWLLYFPDGGAGAGGAPGSGDGANAGGQQGAVTPEQLQQLKSELADMVSGAIDGRLNRLGIPALVETVAALNTHLESNDGSGSAQGGKSGGSDGKGTSQIAQLQAKVGQLEKLVADRGQELLSERKTNALRAALSKSGVRPGAPLEDALAILMGREDVKQDDGGAWLGQGKSELGDPVQQPLETVVAAWVKDRPHLLPPKPGSGSGAAGSDPQTFNVGGQQKTLGEMTEEEVEGLADADFANAYGSNFGEGSKGLFS